MGSSQKMTEFLARASAGLNGTRKEKDAKNALVSLFDTDSFVCLDQRVVSRSFSQTFDRPQVEGDGVVVGYGTIGGRLVFAASQDASVYGGSIGRAHAMKIVKIIEMAISAGAPFVALYSSGGARIEEGILALEGLGGILAALEHAKGNIPIIGAILGPCPGGLALAAAKSDVLFFVENVSGLYMNSPRIIEATNKDSGVQVPIGSSESHQSFLALASFTLPDEESCMDKIREFLEYIPVQAGDSMAFAREMKVFDNPNRTSETLNQIAAESDEREISMHTVFAEVSDSSTYLEISAGYGMDMCAALAKMDGITVGLIGNQKPRISIAGARKAAKFVRFCSNQMIPIITFTQAEGYEISVDAEKSGLVDAAADLVSAFYETDVPRIGILVGKSFGTAYLTMNSKMLGADMVFAWPTAQIAVMSADTAANILFRSQIEVSEDPIAKRLEVTEKYASEISDPSVAAGLGQIDEVILPSTTRPRIISAIDILLSAYPLVEKE